MAYGTYYTMCVRFKGSSIQTDVRRLILGHIGLDGRASMTRQGFHDTACCPGHLEDPVHYVLQCPGLADIRHQFGAVDDAATATWNMEWLPTLP
jgi:hypothetical protein